MGEVIVPKLRAISLKVDGNRVIIIEGGKIVLNLPWNMAGPIGKALVKNAKKAEENEKALQIIKDQALIQRVGFPVGLTNNPEMQKEAMKVAQHDKDLRRFLPGGIKSEGIVGTPTVIKKPPSNGGNNA